MKVTNLAWAKGAAENHFQELYAQLNEEQREAVETIEGPVMVLAGPGTGKTQLVAMRIARILYETQMDPWNILCVTFTESGVVAMRERLVSIIGTGAYYVRISTFHSFCNEIIQDHPEQFTQMRDLQSLTEIERVELFEKLFDELPARCALKPFGSPYFYLRDVASQVQTLKQEHILLDKFKETAESIKGFVEEVELVVADWHALKAKDRTDKECLRVSQVLGEAAVSHQLPAGMQILLKRMYEEYEDRAGQVEGREVGKVRTVYKNEVKKWFDRMARDVDKYEVFSQLYEQYQAELIRRGRYDYEDMINHVVDQLAKDDRLLAHYQEQFQYVLVDEYQDTNGAQNELVRLLGSFEEEPNICVVGDDKQSIYRFQGASLNNMLDFYERYKQSVKVISLKKNYRSQPNVLVAAQSVIMHNEESITKYISGTTDELTAASGRSPYHLRMVSLSSENAEDALVADDIAKLVKGGVAPRDVAVIVRKHRDSTSIFEALQQRQVAVRLEAGEDVLDDPAIQQLLSLLKAVAKDWDPTVLSSVLQLEWLKLDQLDVLKVQHYAGAKYKSLWKVLGNKEELKAAGVENIEVLIALAKQLAGWQKFLGTTSLHNAVYHIVTESGLLDYLVAGEDRVGVLQKLTRLLEEIKQYNAAQKDITLEGFLQSVERLREHGVALHCNPWQSADNAVRVMTAHKAKGLEFEHVYIMRLNDKHWGNTASPEKFKLPHGLVRYDYVIAQKNNEDERRLFYVAMTRAHERLTLTRAEHNGQGKPTVPAIFWHEITPDLADQKRVIEDEGQSLERLLVSLRPLVGASSGKLRDWLEQKLIQYVMSVTHLNNYLKCPRQFYIRNVLRVPSARTQYQTLGTVIHETLEGILRLQGGEKKLLPIESVRQVFEKSLGRQLLSNEEREDIRQVAWDILVSYWEQAKNRWSLKALGEYNFQSHGVHVGEAAITGKIDKIELIERDFVGEQWPTGAAVRVVDYKTGQPDGKSQVIKPGGDYYRQLVFYKLLCAKSPRFYYEMVTGEIDFIQPNRRGQFIRREVKITQTEMDELAEIVERVWGEIMALRFLDDELACGECEYCTEVADKTF